MNRITSSKVCHLTALVIIIRNLKQGYCYMICISIYNFPSIFCNFLSAKIHPCQSLFLCYGAHAYKTHSSKDGNIIVWEKCKSISGNEKSEYRENFYCMFGGGGDCEVSCGHHRQRGKTTTGSALDGAVLDFTQILAYLVHNMSRSQLYLGFGHFGWLPFFAVNNILAGLWLNCISSVEITLFLLIDTLLQHRALFQC